MKGCHMLLKKNINDYCISETANLTDALTIIDKNKLGIKRIPWGLIEIVKIIKKTNMGKYLFLKKIIKNIINIIEHINIISVRI